MFVQGLAENSKIMSKSAVEFGIVIVQFKGLFGVDEPFHQI